MAFFSLQSFWSCLNNILKDVFEKKRDTEAVSAFKSIPCKDPLTFCWWLITHLALLHHVDRNGNVDEKVGLFLLLSKSSHRFLNVYLGLVPYIDFWHTC